MYLFYRLKLDLKLNRVGLVALLAALAVLFHVSIQAFPENLSAIKPVLVAPIEISTNLVAENPACDCSNCDSGQVFHIASLVNSYKRADNFAKQVAKQLEGMRNIQCIKLTYYSNHENFKSRVAKGDFDLLAIKPSVFERLAPSVFQSYIPIAAYRISDAFFISDEELPNLDSADFAGKRKGLHCDWTSQSGYEIPYQIIQKNPFQDGDSGISRYPSHRELRDALSEGKVKIIGSYWSKDDRERYPDWHVHKVAKDVEGTHWYIKKKRGGDPRLTCAVTTALQRIADSSNDSYFSDIKMLQSCGIDSD